MTTSRRSDLAPAAAVFLLTLLGFLRTLGNGFLNFDDNVYVTENPLLRDLGWDGIRAIVTSFVSAHYHPLTILSLALDYGLWGGTNPLPYHAVNALLHACAAVAVYFVGVRILRRRDAAFIGALLFALHPMRVESVAWIAERKDVLSSALLLAAVAVYIRRLRSKGPGFPVASFVLFLLSMLAKVTAAPLPLLLLLVDSLEGRSDHRRMLWEKAPFVAVAVALGIVAVIAQSAAVPNNPPLADRPFLMSFALLYYAGTFLLPLNQCAIIPFPGKAGGALPWFYYASLPLLAAAVAAAVRAGKRDRRIAAAFAAFAIPLVPLLLKFPAGPAYLAERYTYLPHVPLALLAGALLMRTGTLARRPATGTAVAAGWVVLLAVLTWTRTGVWESSITLMDDVIAKQPGVPVAYYNRGLARGREGDAAGAAADYRTAVRLDPGYFDAWVMLAGTAGSAPEAITAAQRAVELRPSSPAGYLKLGLAAHAAGDPRQAVAAFRTAAALEPAKAEPLINLGIAHAAGGHPDSAMAAFRRAALLEPSNPAVYYNAGLTAFQGGDLPGAARFLREATRLRQAYPPAWYLLGGVLNDLGDREASVQAWVIAARQGSVEAQTVLRQRGVRW